MRVNIFLIFLIFPLFIMSQNSSLHDMKVDINNGSISLNIQKNQVNYDVFSQNINSLFRLDDNNILMDVSEKKDNLGYIHYNYKQYYKGIEVDGGLLMVHVKDKIVTSVTGKIAEIDNLDIIPSISEDQAIEHAKNALKVKVLSKKYPVEKLIYWDKHNSKVSTSLVYKVRIESFPHIMYNVYVDAKTGKIVQKISLVCCADHPGKANTYYYGEKDITCDSYSGGYRLRDNARGIHTFDATYADTNGVSENPDVFFNSAADITSSSTDFINTVVAGYTDDVGGDMHWGMKKTYDFYEEVFDRDSYDDEGGITRQYINPPFMHENQNNAVAYPPPYNFTAFGIGDYYYMDYLVALDVVAHEFTHLVINHNGNGGLNYVAESGALNESFADIFGISVEEYAGMDESQYWVLGEEFMLQPPWVMRSLSDPNLAQNPDTYLGQYWVNTADSTAENDNGGVHSNSGVQNYWFYLLSEGGDGSNDFSYYYDVDGIGIEDAQKIAYRNLTTYLTPDANYQDACNGSIFAAIDLFGINSNEYSSVINAWRAVGLSPSISSLYSGCDHKLTMIDSYGDGWNGASVVVTVNGDVVASGACLVSSNDLVFFANDGDFINLVWNSGEWDSEISWNLQDGTGTTIATGEWGDAPGATASCATPILGCTDPSACNFDPIATEDDGSCYNEVYVSIYQDGSVLSINTTPNNLAADWYNYQNINGEDKYWLMKEDSDWYDPKFECSYLARVNSGDCVAFSEVYNFAAEAKRIGVLNTTPNPTNGIVTVDFENINNQYVHLHLMDNNGIKLTDYLTKNSELDIDLSHYPSGTYHLYFDSRFVEQGCNPEDVEMISTKIILNK